MNRLLPIVAFATSLALSACGRSSGSVSLEWPNEAARSAVRRIMVGAYDPAGSSSPSDRTCSSFVGKAASGEMPIGAVNFGVERCGDGACEDDWFSDLVIPAVPKGPRIIYALAYSETDEASAPFLEGCSDKFDSKGGGSEANSVPVRMQLVLPDTARILLTGGSPQVGHPLETTLAPLQARVVAEDPREGGGTYPIPGVEVVFTVESGDFTLEGGGSVQEVYSDRQGNVSVPVNYPAGASATIVKAIATPLQLADNVTLFEQDYLLTVVNQTPLEIRRVINRPNRAPNAVTTNLALGFDGAMPGSVAVLECEGGGELGCTPGITAEPPFGTAALTLIQDAISATPSYVGPSRQGILPAGLVVADLDGTNPGDEIAVLHSRRNNNACQQRTCSGAPGEDCQCWDARDGGPCPCEGASVRTWRLNNQSLELLERKTLTASNAVDMVVVRQRSKFETGKGLAIAGQGRRPQTRPCSDGCIGAYFAEDIPDKLLGSTAACVPDADGLPSNCGCPAGEGCEGNVCVANDKMIDLFYDRADMGGVELGTENFLGCRKRFNICSNDTAMDSSAPESFCQCMDAVERGEVDFDPQEQSCGNSRNRCGCMIPTGIQVGADDSPTLPFSVAAGSIVENRAAGSSVEQWQLVVPSAGGLELYKGDGGDTPPWSWQRTPSVNAPIHRALIADIDTALETAFKHGDVVWYSEEPCTDQGSFIDECPILAPLPDLSIERGCLGAYYSAGDDSIDDGDAACQRHRLDFKPTGMCVGKFEPGEAVDLVLTSRSRSDVYVFRGDARGGFLDPPDRVALPPGTVGGPVVCGDLDGDGLDEVVVADAVTGVLHVLGR